VTSNVIWEENSIIQTRKKVSDIDVKGNAEGGVLLLSEMFAGKLARLEIHH
jgi:hypothetical protein